MSILQFNPENFNSFCDELAKRDKDLKRIIQEHGYPTPWIRPNRFQTLILTILEQQVSLAAAYSAFNRLKAKVGTITPKKILALTEQELRDCYFTRQKIVYAKGLAAAVDKKEIQLKKMETLPDEEVRATLIQLKGIGHWTVDVYLMHALRRTDLFPLGDLALVNSLKHVKKLKPDVSKEKMLKLAEPWKPYRTIASMILWHDYLKRKGTKVQD